ncbi:MAG: hypothetical protein NTW14_09615 [bacterium]|nr:hypothetical protein [bacterium]
MAAARPVTVKTAKSDLICLECVNARFPDPKEQCYKFGGLICTVDDSNVEKYRKCKFAQGVGRASG